MSDARAYRSGGPGARALVCALIVLFLAAAARADSIFDFNEKDYIRPASPPPARPVAVTPTPKPADPVSPPAVPLSPAKRQVPSLAERQSSEKLLKEVYAAELADRTPSVRRSLARRLLDKADVAQSPSAADQFVLLVGARQAAEDATDLSLSIRALDVMAEHFDVDVMRLKVRCAMKAAAAKSDTPARARENCRAGLDLLEELIRAGEWPDASRLVAALKNPAAADAGLAETVRKQARRIDATRLAQERVARDLEKLKSAPADPPANLSVGTFLCFFSGAWERGLPYLAKGSDAKLKDLAAAELSADKDPEKLAALGDRWWAVADAQPEVIRPAVRGHAASIYQRVVPGATGLRKEMLAKRIAEAAVPEGGKVVDLLRLVDPKLDAVDGNWVTGAGSLTTDAKQNARLVIPYQPPDEYDLVVEFTRTGGRDQVFFVFPVGDSQVVWSMGSWGKQLRLTVEGRDLAYAEDPSSTDGGKLFTCVVKVRRSDIEVTLNGKKVAEAAGPFKGLKAAGEFRLPDAKALGIGCWFGAPATFSKIELVEISGTGRVRPRK